MREGVRLTGGHGVTPWTSSPWRVTHASLGATAPASCVNSRLFVYKAEMLCSVWITIIRELANRSCFYASSPVWMGLRASEGDHFPHPSIPCICFLDWELAIIRTMERLTKTVLVSVILLLPSLNGVCFTMNLHCVPNYYANWIEVSNIKFFVFPE